MASASQAIARYAESFGGFEKSAPSHNLAWLKKLRHDGFARFSEAGFPTTARRRLALHEPRAITQNSVSPRAQRTQACPSQEALAPFFMAGRWLRSLVFVDGRFAPALSAIGKLPDGVTVASLAAEIARNPAASKSTSAAI